MINLELEYKPDAPRVAERMEAYWHRTILDRATIQVRAPKPVQHPYAAKKHPTLRDRWMDVDYQVECALTGCSNIWYGGEILPSFDPNLGPESLTAAFGAPLEFGEGTSWSVPILNNWDDMETLRFDPQVDYIQTLLKMIRTGLQAGRGKFVVGYTDIHPGGDLAASLRDPQQLCIDLVNEPDRVRELLERIHNSFFDIYLLEEAIFKEYGQPISASWLPLFDTGRYYIPSNDFSCMISKQMFIDFFIPELLDEIEFLDRSIYHLDGPDALRHLDTLLDIPNLDAIQYVCGAGDGPSSRWMDVFKRIQNAGKCIWVDVSPDEIELFMENLKPEGVMMCTWAPTIEEGEAILKRIASWK